MNLKPIKFTVQVHFIEEDDDGDVIGEKHTDPFIVYGSKAFRAFSKNFQKELEVALNAAADRDPST